MQRGFILQPTYRLEAGRPVVHLYGTLEAGGSFLVRDDRPVPHFWIRAADAERARQLGAPPPHAEPDRRTFDGALVVRLEVARPADAPRLRDRLRPAAIPSYEADVRFADRYLIDRGVRGAIEIRGARRPGDGVDHVFENPEIAPARWAPALSVLSLDIETDPGASRLLSVALVGAGANDVLLLSPDGMTCPAGATPCPDERSLLEAFARRVREIDPDVLTGWNVVDFDLAVLERLGQRAGVPLRLGRGSEPLRMRPSPSPRTAQRAIVPGRLVLDGIDLLRGAFVRLESYALGAAAKTLLGKEKTITGHDRAGQILHAWERDRERFVEYNRLDAQLVLEILEKLQLVELSVERSLLTGMPPDRVAASIASFDFLYLSALGPRGLVAPSVEADAEIGAQPGGHVLEPAPGVYRNVLVLDFRSLYPSVIRTFHIDPLGRRLEGGPADDPIVAPNGAAFSREPGILPQLLDELIPRRAAARAAGDDVASQAIKILMNSFYGVLGNVRVPIRVTGATGAITGFGRTILLWSKQRIEAAGHTVVYGDTDSLFVLSDRADAGAARDLGRALVGDLNADLAAHVSATWRVESRLELAFEKLYLRLLLPALRHGHAGARKRYAGLVPGGDDGPQVEFTGMEAVRRDWTPLARQAQRELYERLFSDRPVETYLHRLVADVRDGHLDHLLVYRKGLRRPLASYTATTPPHVAAARKMASRPGRVISYVMTTDGPEPAGERRSPLDHEHYVRKQVRPVADPVLDLLGLDFDAVVGDEHQMRLF